LVRSDEEKIKLKSELGMLIKTIRSNRRMSQRGLAREIDIPNSNLKYIEDGVNAPSPDIYTKIIRVLKPNKEEINIMDSFYSAIRGTPPPDICDFLIDNEGVFGAIRKNKYKLTESQINKLSCLLEEIALENRNYMEDKNNG